MTRPVVWLARSFLSGIGAAVLAAVVVSVAARRAEARLYDAWDET